jgi:hypothetical protein
MIKSVSVVLLTPGAADPRERVPGLGWGPVGQLNHGGGGFERVGRGRQGFEYQHVLVAFAGPALAGWRNEAGVGAFDDVEDRLGCGGGVVQAPAPNRDVLPDGVERAFVAVPAIEPSPVAGMRHVPGGPDLPRAHGEVEFEQPPVGGDRPRWRCVQALIADEFDGGRVGQPRPQQAGLPVVVADDDRLARGHTFLHERHDQGSELGAGAVEAGFVEVAHLAVGRARPHHPTSMSVKVP